MLRYMEHVMARAGHEPIKARNSLEVTEALSREQPAIVVLDVQADEMESVQKALRDRPSAKLIPVIIMVGLPNQPRMSNTIALQPAAIFNKPFSPAELVGTIEQLLSEAA